MVEPLSWPYAISGSRLVAYVSSHVTCDVLHDSPTIQIIVPWKVNDADISSKKQMKFGWHKRRSKRGQTA